MRNSRADVVAAALRVLEAHGLENCSMRRVAAELGVQPSALYHHVADKQTLFALMADEIMRGLGETPDTHRSSSPPMITTDPSCETAPHLVDRNSIPSKADLRFGRELCRTLRARLLETRDAAELIATASAFRSTPSSFERRLAHRLGEDAAHTLLLFTLGHTASTQTRLQAAAFGALVDPPANTDEVPAPPMTAAELERSYVRGVDLILAGAAAIGGR